MGSRDNSLTPVEREAFKRECGKREKDIAMYYCLAEYGMRVSEFAHMEDRWLDRERGIITIPQSKYCTCADCRRHGGVWTPKTEAGARVIPAKGISPEGWNVVETFFGKVKSMAPSRRGLYKRVRFIAKQVGITHPVYPHALRSTSAMDIARRPGVTSTVLQDVFGWAKIETANKYIRASGAESMRAFPVVQNTAPIPAVVKTIPPTAEELMRMMPKEELEKLTKKLVEEEAKPKEVLTFCDVCGLRVELKDGKWECKDCGASSDM